MLIEIVNCIIIQEQTSVMAYFYVRKHLMNHGGDVIPTIIYCVHRKFFASVQQEGTQGKSCCLMKKTDE